MLKILDTNYVLTTYPLTHIKPLNNLLFIKCLFCDWHPWHFASVLFDSNNSQQLL